MPEGAFPADPSVTTAPADAICVFGSIRTWTGGVESTPAGRLPLRLLAALCRDAPLPTPASSLIEAGWEADPPATAASALRTHIATLRRAIPSDIVATPEGYRLTQPEHLDLVRYQHALADARGRAAPHDRVDDLASAIDLWTGRPFGPLADESWWSGVAQVLEERHRLVEEEWASLVVSQPQVESHLDRMRAQCSAEPLREIRWAHLIEALRRADRINEAIQAYETVRRHLSDELGVHPGAALNAAYDRLFERTGPAPASPRAHVGALGPIIGRNQELAAVHARLAEGAPVTLVGIGGIGKTRIAEEIVETHRRRGQRAWFLTVPPAGLHQRVERELVVQVGLAAPTEDDAHDSLLARLASVDLLVLDAAESCADAVADLAEAIGRRRPRLRLLITSRAPLAFAGEVAVPVHPLRVPLPGEGWKGTAVELLAWLRGRDPTEPGIDADELERDAATTGGVPLLIEIAGHSGPSAPQTGSDAERVTATAVELVADLEDPTRQLALALSVLPGGATVDLAAEILDTTIRDAERRIRHLAWLGLTRAVTSGRTRSHLMLDPVRDALSSRLREDQVQEIDGALLRHLLAVGDEVRPTLSDPPAMDRMHRFDAVGVNLRSVLEDPERAGPVAAAAADFLGSRGYASEAITWLASDLGSTSPHTRAAAALTTARIGRLGANVVLVVDDLVEAEALHRSDGDQVAASFAALYAAVGRCYQGRLDDAEHLLSMGRTSIGHRSEWIGALIDLSAGFTSVLRGTWHEGIAQITSAARRLETIDQYGASLANYVLAASLVADPAMARPQLAHAHEICGAIDDRPMVAGLLHVEAELLGFAPQAAAPLQRAAAALDRAGMPGRAAAARVRAGTILLAAGAVEDAQVELLTALPALVRSRSVLLVEAAAGVASSLRSIDRSLADRFADVCRQRHRLDGYGSAAMVQQRSEELIAGLGTGAPAPTLDLATHLSELTQAAHQLLE